MKMFIRIRSRGRPLTLVVQERYGLELPGLVVAKRRWRPASERNRFL